jgi:hypothetical protein
MLLLPNDRGLEMAAGRRRYVVLGELITRLPSTLLYSVAYMCDRSMAWLTLIIYIYDRSLRRFGLFF